MRRANVHELMPLKIMGLRRSGIGGLFAGGNGCSQSDGPGRTVYSRPFLRISILRRLIFWLSVESGM